MFYQKLLRALTVIKPYVLVSGTGYLPESESREISPDAIKCKKCIHYIVNHVLGTKQVHREDEPAKYCKHGEDWIYNGKRHRIGGPAIISYHTGDQQIPETEGFDEKHIIRQQEWWLYGKKHRRGAPAVIMYSIDGKINREEWWFSHVRHRGLDENKIHQPAIIDHDWMPDTKIAVWYWHGRRHRLNGPAHICGLPESPNYYFAWYKNGKYHRENCVDKFSKKPILENPTIWGTTQYGLIEEWWYDGDLLMAKRAGIVYSVSGSDIHIDGEVSRVDKPGYRLYMKYLRKRMKKMSELKDHEGLTKDSLDLISRADNE